MGVDYYEYIQSAEWRQRADEAKRRAGYRCRVCNRSASQVTLNAHHRTYDRLGHEDPDDITVLCRDCHELYEVNKKVLRPARQQKTQVAYQETWVTPSYTLKQNKLSEAPASSAESLPGSITPWKYVTLVCGGIGVLIFLAWFVSILFPPSPQPTNTSSQIVQTPTSNTPARARQLVSTVKRTTVICGNSCSCSPVSGTINRGTQVTILETASCSGRTWYRIGDATWLAPGLIDNSAPEVGVLTADDTPRLSTPTRGPPTPTAEPLMNEEFAQWLLCVGPIFWFLLMAFIQAHTNSRKDR